MSKISCDTILDLIPLVKDNVASEASKKLVKGHMETCENCREVYDSFESFEANDLVMNEKRIVGKVKKQLLLTSTIIIVIAAMVGLALSGTSATFYNILIMPAIGVIAFFALGKRSYFVAIALFIFSYAWLILRYIAEGLFEGVDTVTALFVPIYWSGIISILCGLGIIIGFLLKYAFAKENIYEK